MSGRTILKAALAAVVAAAGALLAGAVDPHPDRSLAVYPRQELPLRFSHELHLGEVGMSCTDCHDVEKSGRSADLNLPKEATCESCHDIEAAKKGEKTDPPSDCQTCHPGFDATAQKRPKALAFPAPNVKFPHDAHLAKKIPCDRCHGELGKVGLATRAQLPKMETCLDCHHPGGDASGDCRTCHLTEVDGATLLKTLPGGARLVPEPGNPFGVAHGPRYEREHGAQALAASEVCAACHAQSECLACHDAGTKNLKYHPNDWLTLHPVPAKHGALACQSCHNHQQFCAECHERSGVGRDADERFRPLNLRVHPPPEVWSGTQRGPQHHAVWASRDIASCASCHREETCLECHAVGARGSMGISPHPSGFGKEACSMWRKNARVCLKCHTPTDAAIQGCR